jgi:glycosyltransferase involved in cell wall biosynthesis
VHLAFFVDQVFWRDGAGYSSDEAYTLFPVSFCSAFDRVTLIGRLAPEPDRKPYPLAGPAVDLCPLPYYRSVREFWRAGRRLRPQIRQAIVAGAQDWDVVLVCGPNPAGQLIAELCVELGRPVALVVRQNLIPQVRYANRGLARLLGVAMAAWLEWRFRQLARGRTVFTVGEEMAAAYRKVTDRVHPHFASLITDEQLADFSASPPQPEPDRLLFVGRLSAEKGLSFLLEALAQLRQSGYHYRLDIVGAGPYEQTLRAQVAALGLEQQVRLCGYVAYGEALLRLYQRATAVVVPSLSGEGFPQVINEALAVGVPVITTPVGGIPAFLRHGETALLVRPADVSALAGAIGQLMGDSALRQHLRNQGQALMRGHTLEANRDRILNVLETEVLHEPLRSRPFGAG